MTSDRRTHLLGRRARRPLLALTVLLLGCGDATREEPVAVTGPDLVIAAAEGDTDFFDIEVDLGLAFCSTAAGCPTTLAGETKPSLVTGATCSMPDAWDGFLLYARRLACYTGGTLSDPSTWTGESVVSAPPTTTEERAYSAVIASNDTEYVNSSQYLEPLTTGSPSHCYYEAEALIVPTAADANPREVYHRQHPARMTWDVVYEPGASSDKCHFTGSPALSGVDVDYPASVTVSLPSDTDKGVYPVTFDYATIRAVTLNDGADFGAARVRYVLATAMPVPPAGIPTWAERDVWIEDSGSGVDTEIDSTCVRVDPSSGALLSIGILLRDASDQSMLGAIEVLSTNTSSDRFDCDRTGGVCSLIPYTGDVGGEAICAEVIAGCHNGQQDAGRGELGVDCGGGCGPCPAGDTCETDADCLSGYCDDTSGPPYACAALASCLALHTENTATPSGAYEIDPDGSGGASPFMAYCDMTSGDAGWTLVMRLSTDSNTLTYDASPWEGTGTLNDSVVIPNTDQLTSIDAKFEAYNSVTGSTLRLDWIGVDSHDPAAWTYTPGGTFSAYDAFTAGETLVTGNEGSLVCHDDLLSAADNYDGSHMYFGEGSQFYGFNGEGSTGARRIRWGFGASGDTLLGGGLGQNWDPLIGIGSSTASIFWVYTSDCGNCGCTGTDGTDDLELSGNLWIK